MHAPRIALVSALFFAASLAGAAAARSADSASPAALVSVPAAGPDRPAVRLGVYRAVLHLPSGELPFGLELAAGDRGAPLGHLLNGKERVEVTEVRIAGAHLEMRMPGYENRLIAEARGDALHGEVVLSKPGAKEQHIPLDAKLGDRYRFFAEPTAGSADVSGRWSVTFTDDEGNPEAAVGEFSQQGDAVTGTFLAETGDHRYLSGQVRNRELYLSTFDGAHAFLYHAAVGGNATLTGDFWVGTAHHEHWTGKRDPRAALPDAYALTRMRPGAKRFDFAFPDLEGKTVTSADPRFRGKVLIVALAGSWCPNCHDEAAFLEPLYREYRAKGVEVVSLMFEHFGDFPRAAEATQRFRRHYGIGYTTLIAGISDKDEAGKKLPMLQKFVAFPTTVFVDKQGVVRKIHTGFSGPATGDHYTQFVGEVRATLDALLRES
ncbi:MAG TPA: TlpA disulfide reductase family protein [Steroidobacteraceae bacterium]|jgi:peroxiredoxin|nr:TlpA disulfide reductase family protein [Steroidobacteraceae bacterium]